jgi:hypothetical protein
LRWLELNSRPTLTITHTHTHAHVSLFFFLPSFHS